MPRRLVLLAACVVAGAGLLGGPVAADEPASDRVTSNYESFWTMRAARDCGYSEPIPGAPGESFWLFCDTTLIDPAGTQTGFIVGSTAARGPTRAGRAPTTLNEIPTPPEPLAAMPHQRGPALFLPLPTGLARRDGSPCTIGSGSYAAKWTGGVARIPGTGRMLLPHTDVCVEGEWEFSGQRFGLIEYDPATNHLTPPVTLWAAPIPGTDLAPKSVFASPVFDDGHLYVYSSECSRQHFAACETGGVYVARVPVDQRNDPAAYQVWQGLDWGTQREAALGVVPGARPLGIHVDDFRHLGHGIVLIETTSIAGDYRVWHADHPRGPWALRPGDRVIDRCAGGAEAGMCYALIGQPELSTPESLAFTYYASTPGTISVVTSPW